jgi:hypothetical protein
LSAPRFIEIHGLGVPAEPAALPQTFAAPYAGRPVRLSEFLLPASTPALQRVCDTLFNVPSGGAVKYEPLMPLAMLSVIDLVRLSASEPPQSTVGWFKERDAVFWFLAVTTDTATGTTGVAGVPLYAFVDQPQALLTGREVQGWPKELSTLTIDSGPDGHLDRLVVSTIGMPALGTDVQAMPIDVLRVSQVPGSAGLSPANVTASLEDVLRLVWDVGGAALKLLRPHVVSKLMTEFRGGRVPLTLLKQFRDAGDGTKACYQAIVNVPVGASAIRSGGILPGTYLVELPDVASHPIASDLGIDRSALSSVKGLWLDFDMVLERGVEIWRAS